MCIGVLLMGFAIVTNVFLVTMVLHDYDIVDVTVEEKTMYYNSQGELVRYVTCDDGIEYIVFKEDYGVMQEGEKYRVCRYCFHSGFWVWTDLKWGIKNVINEDIEVRV